MNKEVLDMLGQIQRQGQAMLAELESGQAKAAEFAQKAMGLSQVIAAMEGIVPAGVYGQYKDFFVTFGAFCRQCADAAFLADHVDDMDSSLHLFTECMDDLKTNYMTKMKVCPCCGREVLYDPSCPECGAGGRGRLMVSFLEKEGLREAPEGTKLLHMMPDEAVAKWITSNCPHIDYKTTAASEIFDIIICSGNPGQMHSVRETADEVDRLLKPDGRLVFLFPVLEEWEKEERFYIHSLGKAYFGEDIFSRCGLEEADTLHVLTRSKEAAFNMAEKVLIDEVLCREGPLVSVMLPCYNHEKYVAQAIESVLNQSYKNIEIIAIDDGSTDNSAAVMQKYSSHFAKEFYFKENAGGRTSKFFRYAKGKYIALMHSDDVWEKDKLALQVAYMEKHEECGVCLTWCMYTNEELEDIHNLTFIKANRSSHEWMRYFWEKGNALCNPSSLCRREISMKQQKYGYACRQLPDFFKWVGMVQQTTIHIIPKVLIRMRRYGGENQQNTSILSSENLARLAVEEGCNWLWVIRDMEADFFRSAFKDLMIDPQAGTETEIKCEKYFLMLKHTNAYVQNSALCYYHEIFDNDVLRCMEEKYHYTRMDFAKDMVTKGIARH